MQHALATSSQPHPQSGPQTMNVLVCNIGTHYFGAIIDHIQDVIRRSPTTPVPLTSPNIVGLLNLRGHIVTEIDVAKTLGIADESDENLDGYSVVINKDHEMYSLVFDGVGDVIDIPVSQIENLPFTIDKTWSALSHGVYRLNDKLLVILDFDLLINKLTTE